MTVVTVTKEIEFDAAHRLPLHDGKCRNLHGHRYRVACELHGEVNPDDGMVLDFGIVKDALKVRVHALLDHATIVQDTDAPLRAYLEAEGLKHYVVPFASTAEMLAAWCYDQLHDHLDFLLEPRHITLTKVTVWETPTGSCSYEVHQ